MQRLLCLTLLLTLLGCSVVSSVHRPDLDGRPDPSAAAYYHFIQGYLAELNGHPRSAAEEYRQALQHQADSVTVLTATAQALAAVGQLTEALTYAEAAVGRAPADPALLQLTSRLYLATGQPDMVPALYEKAVEAEPGSAELHVRLGLAYATQQQYKEAKQAMLKGLDLAPAFEPARLGLGSLYEQEGEREKAIEIYRQILAMLNPDSRPAHNRLLQLYRGVNDSTAAFALLEDWLGRHPHDLDAHLQKGLLLAERQEYDEAVTTFERLVSRSPLDVKLRTYLAYLYEQVKALDKAVVEYTQLIQLDPASVESRLRLGHVLSRLGRHADATLHLQEALRLAPTRVDVHLVLGLTYAGAERYEEAVVAYQNGLVLESKNPDLHFHLGAAYDKLDRFKAMEAEMEEAIGLDPRHSLALNYLGYSYVEQEMRLEEALAMIQRALEVRPEDGYYVDSLGWAYYKLGRLDDATRELERAIQLVTDDPVIYEHLGELYSQQERRAQALEAWVRSLELDPANTRLMERFREAGFGEPTSIERIRQALDQQGRPSIALPSPTPTLH